MKTIKRFLFFIIYFIISCYSVYSQGTMTIKGTVVDAENKESVPFTGIVIEAIKLKTVSNIDGEFSFRTSLKNIKIKVSSIGYETETFQISTTQKQPIIIKLKQESKALNEVVIKAKKQKYKNKNNPAVELIEKVISHKKANRAESFDYYENEKYEKILFALSNITPEFKQKKSLKKFQFIFENTDTTMLKGKEVLPMYLKESLSDCYYRRSPKSKKEINKANKMVSFEGYVDNQGITAYLKYFYQDINIYDNNIIFLSNQFLSPLAPTAPVFYKFFILDTVKIDNQPCVHMVFAPRNKTDLLFQGYLDILLDSSYAVKQVEMSVNNQINLNWVKSVKIHQKYDRIDNNGFMITDDKIDLDFGLTNNGLGMYGEREVSYRKFSLKPTTSDSIFSGLQQVTTNDADLKTDSFWRLNRHTALSKTEAGTYVMIDSIKQIPAFKRTMDIMMLLLAGYKDFGYFEIGPVNTFYSYNPIEGFRLRAGGRTTPKFSKKINFETYLAYGFKDEKYKGYLGSTYSLTDKSIYEFPVKYVKASYQYETKIPGQDLEFIQEDNILLSIKRGVNDKMFYTKKLKLEHLNEFDNHFSYTVGYQFVQQKTAGQLFFNTDNYLQHVDNITHLNSSEPYLVLRYAPHEQFYQGKLYRVAVANGYPVYQLQCNFGSKYAGNDYNYSNIKFSYSKRIYMSVLGYSDVIWESGKIIGKVPYPLLNIHRANQTYSYQISSYNMMNFLEFVSDEYTSLNVDHCFNGFFFNKIPIINRLKFREVATVKVLYGGLSDSNNPNKTSGLFKFPVDDNGTPLTYTFGSKPYVEGSVGVSNIFKFFRLDLVKRFTYLDHPNVATWGVRARFKFDF